MTLAQLDLDGEWLSEDAEWNLDQESLQMLSLSISARDAKSERLPETQLKRYHFPQGNQGMKPIRGMECVCGGLVYANDEFIRCVSCDRAWPIDAITIKSDPD